MPFVSTLEQWMAGQPCCETVLLLVAFFFVSYTLIVSRSVKLQNLVIFHHTSIVHVNFLACTTLCLPSSAPFWWQVMFVVSGVILFLAARCTLLV